jgi:uncharacterized membrane protein (UPF0127 family)
MGFLMLAVAACDRGPRVGISDANGLSKAVVNVEVADTPQARELGLMYRQHLAENAGMLFVFKRPQHLTFWMKNTEIPLDMIFAAPDCTVLGIVANAEPFSERELSVAGDSLGEGMLYEIMGSHWGGGDSDAPCWLFTAALMYLLFLETARRELEKIANDLR